MAVRAVLAVNPIRIGGVGVYGQNVSERLLWVSG